MSALNICVGIITYERPDCVKDLLESLEDQLSNNDEIIIVDDSDGEQTKEVVDGFRDKFSQIDYIGQDEKTIQGVARNKIIESTSKDIICFLDDDTVCEKNYISSVRKGYEKNDIVALGGPALDVDEEGNLLRNIVSDSENQNKINKYGEEVEISDRWVPNQPVETELFRGANMSFMRENLEEIEGFKSIYRGNGYREETDVIVRINNKGKILYHPQAKVYHKQNPEGGSREHSKKSNYWDARNHIIFLKENFPNVFWISVLRLIIHTQYYPRPMVRQLPVNLIQKDTSIIHTLKGYSDGVYEVIK